MDIISFEDIINLSEKASYILIFRHFLWTLSEMIFFRLLIGWDSHSSIFRGTKNLRATVVSMKGP